MIPVKLNPRIVINIHYWTLLGLTLILLNSNCKTSNITQQQSDTELESIEYFKTPLLIVKNDYAYIKSCLSANNELHELVISENLDSIAPYSAINNNPMNRKIEHRPDLSNFVRYVKDGYSKVELLICFKPNGKAVLSRLVKINNESLKKKIGILQEASLKYRFSEKKTAKCLQCEKFAWTFKK